MADMDFIYGIHPVLETLKGGRRKIFQLLVSQRRHGPQVEKIILLARKNDITVVKSEDHVLDKLARGGNHQGVIAKAEKMTMLSLRDALDLERNNKNAVWLAVDEITDPQNLGTMIRSAACLGATTVLLPSHRTADITPAVHKAASGAMERIRIVPVVNLAHSIMKLREEGFWIYGADMGGKPLSEVKFNRPMLLIIGSEGKGLRQKTGEHCDEIVSIPQTGKLDSLNAACACSIILYEVLCAKRNSPAAGNKA